MSHRIVSLGFIAVLGLAGTIVGLPRAIAADLDVPYGEAPEMPEQKVEFGSGWYIRGDIGASHIPSLRAVPPALPTVEDQNPPNAPTVALTNSSPVGYVASLGAGYQFNNWIRSDVVADFRQPLSTSAVSGNNNVFCETGITYPDKIANADGSITYGNPEYASGACTGNYKANLKSFDVLVNGYVDLGTWRRVTPYVGAGVGLSFGHYQASAKYIQSNGIPYMVTVADPKFNTSYYYDYDRNSSQTYYNLAWAVMAGFSVDVYDHTKLDIGYRYLNLGTVPGLSGDLVTQEVRVGLRYMIDN